MSKFHIGALLAVTDQETGPMKAMIDNYSKYFSNNQGDFRGLKKTYEPKEGTIDEPKNRAYKEVVTTVDEKLTYFIDQVAMPLHRKLSLEATNASGTARAELVVGDKAYGVYSTMELLGMKTFFSNPKLQDMIKNIPVRPDDRTFSKSPDYGDRAVVMTPTSTYTNTTTEKTSRIMADPNVAAAIAAGKTINYSPQVETINTPVVLGEGQMTEYSGEWSHTQRAHCLNRLAEINKAIVAALAVANQTEIVATEAPISAILQELFGQ